MRRLSLLVLVGLAACGTPQERCISGATRDARVIDRLISETQTNLARGYAVRRETIYRTVWVRCEPNVIIVQPDGSRRVKQSSRMCLEDVEETIQRPQAIDPAEERRKLDGLTAQRARLDRQAESVIAQCQALYPE